jgi:ribokinase
MNTVFVAGSINMDIVVKAARHPRIGETVTGQEVRFLPGGKGANQAVSSARLGAPTALIGKLGQDSFGRELRAFLTGEGINLDLVRETPDAHSGTAVISVAEENNTIVVIPGANALLTETDVEAPALSEGDVAVSEFEIPLATVKAFFQRARRAGARTLLNPAPALQFDRDLLRLVDIFVLNETELGFFADEEIGSGTDSARIARAARALRAFEGQVVCVTLGEHGVLALLGEMAFALAGRRVRVADTTGAGDCFVGAIAARLAAGVPIENALSYANIAASICVQKLGAGPSMPTAAQVQASIAASS